MQYEIETMFACAHFYKLAAWTPEQNQIHFGKCYSEQERGHGHDYRLQVKLHLGEQTLTAELREAFKASLSGLREELDHKHLNFEVPGLAGKVPTTENLARHCFRQLQKTVSLPFEIRLFERPDIWVEIYE